MPRFAANLSLMYAELPFMQRFAAAAADGFEAVEYLFPYDWPAHELAAQLRAHGLRQVLLNTPAGGGSEDAVRSAWARGLRGTASLPGCEADFRHGVQLALRYADALDCPRIHLMAGIPAPGQAHADCERTYRHNLQWAARQAQAAGREVLIEPINARDMPGYFLHRQAQAHDTVLALGEPALKVQMDLYHCQVSEGDVSAKLRQYLPTGRVAHLQVAGVPERHEPDVGELNADYLFDLIDTLSAECGWQGWVGCEYRPRAGTSQGLGWLRRRQRTAN